MRTILPALLLSLALAGVATADTVVLTNGRRVPAVSVTEANGRVIVDHGCGRITLPKHLVAKIERDEGVAPATTRSR